MKDLLLMSGSELARRIRRRELSSAEVVDAHIRHIERVNPVLNAVVKARFDEARAEAQSADRALAEGRPDLGAFHGVPCTIKEAFAVRGMPHTSGLVARKGRVAESDAVAVTRMRGAGAIVLGVTNISELCMWMESINRVYGKSSNPYDETRTVGGSSGGEGAIVGAGGAPFGLGSDVGGSIRLPAFFNGVFGHKPTPGLVPNEGQYPAAVPGINELLGTGPIARRAEDLHPLLTALATGAPPADPRGVDVSRLHVLSVEEDGRSSVDPELCAAQERAARALADRGATVKKGRVPGFRRSLEIWSAMMDAGGGPSFSEMLGEGVPIPAGRELLRWAVGRSPYTLPALGLALFEKVPKLLGPERGRRFAAMGEELRREVIDLIGPDGVMLYPPYPMPAPKHHAPLFPPFRWVYTAIFNALRLPVTQVPLGLGREGLPLGVQVASIPGNDHITLAVALELERALGGWVPPPRWIA